MGGCDGAERADAGVVRARRLRAARGHRQARARRRVRRDPARHPARPRAGPHARHADRARERGPRDALLLERLHARPPSPAPPVDPRIRPLPARHARREEGDPRPRRLRALDRRLHARSAALRPGLRAGRALSLRGARLLIDLPRTASTVIVGGGIVGVAAAFFLGERGETDVLLLERDRLGAGTTKGGLGGIRHQFVDELDVRLSQLATTFWREFEERTGSRHDFAERGYLFVAETEEGMAQLRGPLALYERLGVPVEMVDRIRIRELVPGMRVDDLRGGRFCERHGYGDPPAGLPGLR